MKRVRQIIIFFFMWIGCILVLIAGFVIEILGVYVLGKFVTKIGRKLQIEGLLVLKSAYELSGVSMSYETRKKINSLIQYVQTEIDKM